MKDYTIVLSAKELENLNIFLQRITLNAGEVAAYVTLLSSINSATKTRQPKIKAKK